MFFFLISDLHEGRKQSLETNRKKRSRDERSTSHKHLEVVMVADDLLVKAHEGENLEMYLLMIAHVVKKLHWLEHVHDWIKLLFLLPLLIGFLFNQSCLIQNRQVDNMFHDESVGEKKLKLVVVKIFIKKDGVGWDKLLIIVYGFLQSVGLHQFVDRLVHRSVGRLIDGRLGRSIRGLIYWFSFICHLFSWVTTLQLTIEKDWISYQAGEKWIYHHQTKILRMRTWLFYWQRELQLLISCTISWFLLLCTTVCFNLPIIIMLVS